MAETGVDTYLKNGKEFLEQGNYDKAIEEFTEALKFDQNLIEAKNGLAVAHFNRGINHYRSGDADKAVAEMTEAIRFNPNDAKAYGARGTLLDQKNDHDGTIRDFTDVIRLEPMNAVPYDSRGHAYYQKSKKYLENDHENYFKYFDLAIKDWEEAVKLDPSNELYQRALKAGIGELAGRKRMFDSIKT